MLQLVCEILLALVFVYVLYLGFRMLVRENEYVNRIGKDKREDSDKKCDDTHDITDNKPQK